MRTIRLDAETDQLLNRLAKRYDDNRSMAVREAIRKAAEQYERKPVEARFEAR